MNTATQTTKSTKTVAAKKPVTVTSLLQAKGGVPLKTVCAKAGGHPKHARKVLREKFGAIKRRWSFKASAVKQVVALLEAGLAIPVDRSAK